MMITRYTAPDGKQVPRPKSLVIDSTTYVPPTDAQLIEAGYIISEEESPAPEPYLPTYSELVEEYIREHGYPTYGAEIAVLNNYAESPADYLDAWQTYMGVRHEAKQWASTQPHREEDTL